MNSNHIRWRNIKLGEFCDIIMGQSPSSSTYNEEGKGLPFFQGVKDFGRIYPTKRVYCTASTRKIAQAGNILLSVRAPVGEINIASEKCIIGRGIAALRVKTKNKDDQKFLYYLMLFNKKIWKQFHSGTTFEEITKEDIKNLEVLIPESFSERRKIVDILSSLDGKIELNYEMNKTLETIAQAIFKNWFVVFEPFKDRLIYNEELNKEIPEGWKVGTLEDVLSGIESGSRPPGGVSNIKSGIPSIGAEHIIGLGKFDYSKVKYVPRGFYEKMKRGKVRYGDVLLYKDGAYIGRKTYVDYGFPFEKCCVNEHVFILRTNKLITPRYLYFWLDQKWITNLIINMSLTSAQPGLNQQSLKTIPILIPIRELVFQFDRTIEPFIKLIFMNAKEIHILEQIRDTLLPKLLSGKIRVKVDIEKEFPKETKELEEISEEKTKLQASLEKWLK